MKNYRKIGYMKHFDNVEIVEIEDLGIFALNQYNGETYVDCWKCDEYGNQDEEDKNKYAITPIFNGVGEPDECGYYEEYEIIGYEVRRW